MNALQLTDLLIYPLKSAMGIHLPQSQVTERGLAYDRRWVLVDEQQRAITARQYPALLAIRTNIVAGQLFLTFPGEAAIPVPTPDDLSPAVPVQVFSGHTQGLAVSPMLDERFSAYLGATCRLLYMDASIHRPVLSKHGGQVGEVVSFADQCPLLLISEASLADLNTRVDDPMVMDRFRPNLVVSGCAAYAEDTWTHLQIGTSTFRVSQACQRCIFTTIDPVTQQKHPQGEPLRTLATYRKASGEGVRFGVHLIPEQLGKIQINDPAIVA